MSINFNRVGKGFRNEAHLPKRGSIYMGIVKSNEDPQNMGRLMVWISDFGPDKKDFWLVVSYASPFAGATPATNLKQGGTSMEDSQQTYGFWATPPDIGNQVLCCFLDGDIANGFWFSCVYPQNMNHMIPAIGFDPSTEPSEDQTFAPYGPPVVEYNKLDITNAESPTSSHKGRESVKRPVFKPLAEGLKKQGLHQDGVRGPSNTSARRESPSRVFGLLSPRGNSIHIDDGPKEGSDIQANEFIRFRTRSGVQLLISETSGLIYMITKDGKSWVEISDEGIDMYSAGPISMNSDSDVNINAGGTINMQGTQGIHMAAATLTSFTSGDTNIASDENIYMDATRDVGIKSSRDVSLDGIRDVTANAGRNIIDSACTTASRSARVILDNTGGLVAPDVPHAQFDRSPISRKPTHEPFQDRGAVPATDPNGNIPITNSSGHTDMKPMPIPENISERAKVIYGLLKAKGYSDIQIAGILGTFQQESSLNPNAVNSIGAKGLAQWLSSRRTQLENAARRAGKNVNDAAFQIDFFHTDKDGPDGGGAGNKLKAATTVRDAVTAMNYYERFGGWSRSNPTGAGSKEVGNRYQYAANHYAAIQAGKYSSGGTGGGRGGARG